MSQVAKGFLWSSIEKFSVQGISLALSIIIARIISPDDYGLIAMVQVFTSFFQIFIDGGFANALIQKKDRTDIDYQTAFLFNLAVSVLLYFVLFFCAPLIAEFYGESQLTTLTRVVALNLIISSLSIVQRARLTIALDFKTQSKASILATVVSGLVGIYCAYSGWGVWALVTQSLLSSALISVSLMFFSKWVPRLQFSKNSFVGLFGFGSKLMASNVLTSLSINLGNLLIGKRYSAASLAYYNRGFTLSQYPSVMVAESLNRVIFPELSRLQDDRKRLKEAYFKYLHLSNFIILPLMVMLIALARPLVEVLLTEKWLPAVPYIQIMSLNFVFYPWILQSGNPIAAIGHSGILFRYQFVKRGFGFLVLFIAISISVKAICWGCVVGSLLEVGINSYLLKKELQIGFREQVKTQIDVYFAAGLVGFLLFGWTLISHNAYIQLFGGGVLAVFLYWGIISFMKMSERDILLAGLNRFFKK